MMFCAPAASYQGFLQQPCLRMRPRPVRERRQLGLLRGLVLVLPRTEIKALQPGAVEGLRVHLAKQEPRPHTRVRQTAVRVVVVVCVCVCVCVGGGGGGGALARFVCSRSVRGARLRGRS